VIIDLDDREALRWADFHLPATDMIEGRPGKPRSHRCYLVRLSSIGEAHRSTAGDAAPAAERLCGHPGLRKRGFNRASDGKRVIDFIGTGGMVVCPPSRHPSGEVREWGVPGRPAVVDHGELLAAVERVAEAAGWVRPVTTPADVHNPGALVDMDPRLERRIVAYLAECPPAVSGQRGHDQTFAVARAVVWGFGVGAITGYELLAQHYNPD
jgi:hypothetical protein